MAKKKKRRFLGVGIGVIAAIGLLAFAFVGLQALAVSDSGDGVGIDGIEGEEEGDAGEMAVAASAVTNSINYQGRLTDSAGVPLSGTYSMTFRLYEVASGGTALDWETHTVEVTEGLFNTYINIDQSYFDGRELWLGIKVGADAEMTPRQELRPVPYALSLRPGAKIVGSAPVALYAESTHTSGKGISGYATATSGANYGVYGASMSADGAGVYARGIGSGADLILGGNADTGVGDDGKIYSDPAYDSSDIYLITNDGLRIDLDNDGDGEDADFEIRDKNGTLIFNVDESSGVYSHATATTGSNNHGVRAYSDYGYGVYGKGEYGGYFTTNQAGTDWYDRNAGVNATTTYDYSDGVRAHTTGDYSYGVFANTTGYDSDGVFAYTTGDNSYGVCARTYGRDSSGVWAYTTGDNSYGVYVHTTGDNSDGVHVSTVGDHSEGVYAFATGNDSKGVHACSSGGNGVYGTGKCGGYFTTNQDGTWFDHNAGVDVSTIRDYSNGVAASTTGLESFGVYAVTYGDHSDGVSAGTSGDYSHGVSAVTSGDHSYGVYAHSAKSYGVYGRSDSTDSAGVYAQGKDSGADLILGGNADTGVGDDGKIYSDPAYASSDIYLITNDGLRIDLDNDGDGEDADFEIRDKDDNLIFNVDESGEVYADGSFHSGGADVAEYFAVDEDVEAGTVMVIDQMEGSKLRSSTKAYDTTVAGIVSTAPGVSLGTNEEGNEDENLIAVAGRVPCKVDASYAPIEPGDLLTTSDTPGYAMKATNPQIGTILGKALEPLDSGRGVIEVLVTLQ